MQTLSLDNPPDGLSDPAQPLADADASVLVGGRYRLGTRLGQGGMAEVFAAHDIRLGRPVAVKLLRSALALGDDARSRFMAEARAAAALSHPSVVAVYDAGEHDGRPFLVMERLPGPTLADRMASGPVDPGWLGTVLVDVLGGLAAAHRAGIVHRDVKPANILLTVDGRAKVADFGIAKSLDGGGVAPVGDPTLTGQVLGTPAYLAPERLDGSPARPQSDLYGLGVVAYEALAGVKPFTGDSPLTVAQAVADGGHTALSVLRPDLDPDLAALIERSMARDPAERFARAEDFAAAVAATIAVASLADTAPTAAMGSPRGGNTMAIDSRAIDTLAVPARSSTGARPSRRRRAVAPLVARRPAWPKRTAEGSVTRPDRAVLGAGLGVLGVVVLLSLALGAGSPGAATGGAAQAATEGSDAVSLSTESELAVAMRALADELDPASHGRRADDLAEGLRVVAEALDGGDAASEAATLVVRVAAWSGAGEIGAEATVASLALLEQVPGIAGGSVVVADPTPGPAATTAPVVRDRSDDDDEPKAKGKAKGKAKDD